MKRKLGTSLVLAPMLVVIAGLLFSGVAVGGDRGDQDNSNRVKLRATIPVGTGTGQIPGSPLKFFDISWVDAPTHRYFLADRSNAGVDIIDGTTNTFVARIPGFAGQKFNANGSADNDHSGPDGVLVVGNRLFVGDGDSTVKVFDLGTNLPVGSPISTCLPGHTVANCARADEMAYDPKDQLLIVANNAATPDAFMTLISTTSLKVVDQIVFPAAQFSGGIEQAQWDPKTRRFYVSIPAVNGNPRTGAVAVINPLPIGHATIEKLFPVADCNPAGLALGPHQRLLLGCSLTNGQSVIMSATDGHIVKVIHGVGGSDEVWFNAGDGRYYLAARNNVVVGPDGTVQVNATSGNAIGGAADPVLGIIDAFTNKLVKNISTGATTPNTPATSAHSVAADRITNHVFVPLPPNAACPTGCIGVYWSADQDDDD
jgi:hypothetical protein